MTTSTQKTANDTGSDSPWRLLYKISSVAIWISAVIIPLTIVVFFISPPPADGTASDWFQIFQDNSLLGLASFDFLYIITNIVMIPVFLAFYAALRRTNASLVIIATVIGLIGVISLVIARPALEMLHLSNQYAAAATEAQRAAALTGGEVLLATFRGTAFNIHYILGSLALLIISFVMLRSDIFSKQTAYIGIAANIIVFGLYIPEVGTYISAFSVLLYLIWYILVGVRLVKLGWSKSMP
jgi:hypothetical protein